MKCPKCHYLSFDPEPRCRNCGFSLGLEATEATDLPITTANQTEEVRLVDLELRATRAVLPETPVLAPVVASTPNRRVVEQVEPPLPPPPVPQPVRRIPVPRLDRPRTRLDREEHAAAVPAREPVPVSRPTALPTTELPLFVKEMTDAPAAPETEAPPVPPVVQVLPVHEERSVTADVRLSEPVVMGPPVAVMSTAAWVAAEDASPAPVPRRRIGPLDRDLLKDLERIERTEKDEQVRETVEKATRLPDAAGAGRRMVAAIVDGLVLSGILAGLLALTLRWTAIEWSNLAVLPIWPTAAFLTLVAAGYLLLFTVAAGQTPGKMLAGIRVVGAGTNGDGSEPLTPGQACLRELVAVPAVLALGIGFLPALVGSERGVHDRIASTRVVRG